MLNRWYSGRKNTGNTSFRNDKSIACFLYSLAGYWLRKTGSTKHLCLHWQLWQVFGKTVHRFTSYLPVHQVILLHRGLFHMAFRLLSPTYLSFYRPSVWSGYRMGTGWVLYLEPLEHSVLPGPSSTSASLQLKTLAYAVSICRTCLS